MQIKLEVREKFLMKEEEQIGRRKRYNKRKSRRSRRSRRSRSADGTGRTIGRAAGNKIRQQYVTRL